MSVIVEIRAAEGGDDAKSLVVEQFKLYERRAARFDVGVTTIEVAPSRILFRAEGADAALVFRDEAGGHRWQRVPPNEKRGRVHTSTVTVAVLPEPAPAEFAVPESDLEVETSRGSGPGGQHRNKTETAVLVRHIPTGQTVRCESSRSQHQNREMAVRVMHARLYDLERAKRDEGRAAVRRAQVGSGMRGDKRRTIRCQAGTVVDHPTGRRWKLREYLRGAW